MLSFAALALSSLFSHVQAHLNGVTTPAWTNVRQTNNFNTLEPVVDVTSADFRCYDSATAGTASTIAVAAVYSRDCVINVYMAKAPTGNVYQISAVTTAGRPSRSLLRFERPNIQSLDLPSVSLRFPNPCLPANTSCAWKPLRSTSPSPSKEISVTGGGSGTPGPLVAIPGVYTGNEPGIFLNIYFQFPQVILSLDLPCGVDEDAISHRIPIYTRNLMLCICEEVVLFE
ncbi:glycoside hydrolase family 61 protein [Mycena leptocephala]|nr:glycoside hydrolase family 61 protein [Mycena leptocephala]